MTESQSHALARTKAAAAAHGETYVELPAADVAELTAVPAAAATPAGRGLFAPAAAAARKDGATMSLHREKHLAPLLAAVEA